MEEKDKVQLTELKSRISKHFIENGWITVSDHAIHSALASDDVLLDCLKSYEWDLRRGENGQNEVWSNGKWSYNRIGPAPIEPFAIYRDSELDKEDAVELPDDFRLYFGMRLSKYTDTEQVYSIANENGEWEEVVRVDHIKMTVKAKIIRQYMAMRKMNLLIFFDVMTRSDKAYDELGITPLNNDIQKGADFIYNYTSLVKGFMDGHTKSGGWMMGKCVLRYNPKDYNPDDFTNRPKKYENFIIGYDELGDEIVHSCKKDTLSNYFVPNGNEPMEMTPVFFKKAVLDKYYDNPNKYDVEDGSIFCLDRWSLRIDNNQRDYVVVMLVDLGLLPYTEQQYWKGFNVARDDKMRLSKTAFERWIMGAFYDPTCPDLRFKFQFKQFNEKWQKKFGWPLFLPLAQGDEHYFKTLHCLTVKNNIQDYEKQVGALAKITIDSLNQKELANASDEENAKVKAFLANKGKETVKDLTAGIDKLECFLYTNDINCPPLIEYLRKVQAFRSFLVAHRKTTNKKDIDKLMSYFKTEEGTEQSELEQIFVKMVMTINTLESIFLK